MSLEKKISISNSIFFILLIVISINVFFQSFYKMYIIMQRNYDERMVQSYGYCEKESYGFVSYIYKKYDISKDDKVQILNIRTVPPIQPLIKINNNKVKREKNSYYLILNFEEKNDYRILDLNIKNFDNFKFVEKQGNCYFYKHD